MEDAIFIVAAITGDRKEVLRYIFRIKSMMTMYCALYFAARKGQVRTFVIILRSGYHFTEDILRLCVKDGPHVIAKIIFKCRIG